MEKPASVNLGGPRNGQALGSIAAQRIQEMHYLTTSIVCNLEILDKMCNWGFGKNSGSEAAARRVAGAGARRA